MHAADDQSLVSERGLGELADARLGIVAHDLPGLLGEGPRWRPLRRWFGYLNLKFAECVVPPVSFRSNWRQVPAHDFSVFQT